MYKEKIMKSSKVLGIGLSEPGNRNVENGMDI